MFIDVQKSRTSDDDATLKVNPRSTLVFKLCIKCKKNAKFKGSAADHNLDEMYIDHKGRFSFCQTRQLISENGALKL